MLLAINPIFLAALSGLAVVIVVVLLVYLLRAQTSRIMERERKFLARTDAIIQESKDIVEAHNLTPNTEEVVETKTVGVISNAACTAKNTFKSSDPAPIVQTPNSNKVVDPLFPMDWVPDCDSCVNELIPNTQEPCLSCNSRNYLFEKKPDKPICSTNHSMPLENVEVKDITSPIPNEFTSTITEPDPLIPNVSVSEIKVSGKKRVKTHDTILKPEKVKELDRVVTRHKVSCKTCVHNTIVDDMCELCDQFNNYERKLKKVKNDTKI